MRHHSGSPPSTYDVVVVGGGLSGVLVAKRLVRAGARVLVLEAGSRPDDAPPPDSVAFERAMRRFARVDEARWRYACAGRPYEWQRVRAFGGRSLLWGGWCSRPISQSWRDAAEAGAPWPLSMDELSPFLARVERSLRVRTARLSPGSRHVRSKLGVEVTRKRCGVAPAGARPMTALDLAQGLTVRANATALHLLVEDSAVKGISFVADGAIRELLARAVVLCASPIETARILAASGVTGPIGEGFCDHLVASCIAVQDVPGPPGPSTPLAPAAFVPRFVNLGRGHKRDYVGGFTSEIVGPRSAVDLPRAVHTALRIGAADAPKASFYVVHAIGEMMPEQRRRVTFDRKHVDSLGRPIPVLRFARTASDVALARDLGETVAALADAIALPGSRIVPIRDPAAVGGAGHEAGTCAMGAPGAVTDRWGAVRGLRGVWIADASVMPTALDRHPTLTVLALALRTAERIVETVRRGEA